MARQRKKQPRTLELSDRDYRRLQLALEDLEEATTRAEVRDAEAAVEQLGKRLELDDALLDDLLDGNVELADDDDAGDDDRGSSRSSSRRRDDDDDRGGRGGRGDSAGRRRDDDDDDGRRASSSSSASSRRVRVVERDDDDDDGGRRASSLKDLQGRPGAKPAKRQRDGEPSRTPETTHWFHRRLGQHDAATGASS